MYKHTFGTLLFTAVFVAGCADTPVGVQSASGDVENAVDDSSGAIEESLVGFEPDIPGGCRKEVTTGTRVKRHTCKPAKDDSELIPLISSPPD